MIKLAPLFLFCLAAVYGCHSDLYIKDIADHEDTETVSNIKDTSDANTNNDTGTTEDTDSNTNWDTESRDTDSGIVTGWSLIQGEPGWQWQMQGSLDLTLDVEVFIMELFAISTNDIQTLHDKKK